MERTWRFGQGPKPAASGLPSAPEDTRGPRRLGGTLNPPGTAARSNNGRGVCGPGRPKDEDPGRSGQRAPAPRSALLCGESGSLAFTLREALGDIVD
ncbi:hypothetical protein GCM10010129_64020 [Streptomyces fumigatiscleroticus]|nr:hypothetical protein GCM10010129_64020 [Streptomyces fumigatiscleroticus]